MYKRIVGIIQSGGGSNRDDVGLDFNEFAMWAKNWEHKAKEEADNAVKFKALDTDKSGTLGLKEA